MKRLLTSIVGVAVLLSAGYTIFPNVAEPNFKSVGRMGNWNGTTFSGQGSCVAISPYWVLTAAHVGGNTIEQDGIRYPILQRIGHTGSGGVNADLAAVRVQGPMKFASPLAFRPFTGTNALQGLTSTLAGLGITGQRNANVGWSIQWGTDGTRRSAKNALDDYFPQVQVQISQTSLKTSDCLVYDLDDPLGVNTINVLGGTAVTGEGGLAPRDSGGGCFVLDNGQNRLVGINAYVGVLDGTPVQGEFDFGAVGLSVALNSYKNWITSTVPDIGRTIWESRRIEFGGRERSGAMIDMEASDNVRYELQSPPLGSGDFVVLFGVAFTGTTTAVPATNMDITIEGKLNAGAGAIQIALKNWNTNAYEPIHAGFMHNTDETITLTNVPAANRVSSTGKVDLRFRVLAADGDYTLIRPAFDLVKVIVR